MTVCVGRARLRMIKIGVNSTREIALEYAKGIGKPSNQRLEHERINADNIPNYENEEIEGGVYQNEYSYQSPLYTNMSQLEENHTNFSSELDKIRNMFQEN